MAKIFNKVIYDGATLMDISHDTVTAAKMLVGTTAHAADGTLVTGTKALATATVSGETLTLTDGFPVEVS